MADYFTSTNAVGSFGNLKKFADDADNQQQIEDLFPSAKKDVVRLVGSDKYDELIAEKDNEDNEDVKLFTQAESYFVLARLIPQINILSTGGGVTKVEGFGDGRKEYLNESDLESLIKRYRNDAEDLLQEFMVIKDEDNEDIPNIVVGSGFGMIAP